MKRVGKLEKIAAAISNLAWRQASPRPPDLPTLWLTPCKGEEPIALPICVAGEQIPLPILAMLVFGGEAGWGKKEAERSEIAPSPLADSKFGIAEAAEHRKIYEDSIFKPSQ